MKNKYLKIIIGIITLCLIIFCGIYYYLPILFTTTNNFKIKIRKDTYFIRGTIGGIGGSELVTIGTKKHIGWRYDKDNEISYSTSDLSSVYFEVINDTIQLYIEKDAPDSFLIPLKAGNIPFRCKRIEDISPYKNVKCIIDYYPIKMEK